MPAILQGLSDKDIGPQQNYDSGQAKDAFEENTLENIFLERAPI